MKFWACSMPRQVCQSVPRIVESRGKRGGRWVLSAVANLVRIQCSGARGMLTGDEVLAAKMPYQSHRVVGMLEK